MAGNIKDLIVRIMVDDADVEKFQKAGGKAFEFGNVVNAGAVAAAGGLALLGGAAVGATVAAAEVEAANDRLAASLGLTESQASAMADATQAVYANAFGDSLESVQAATAGIITSIEGMRDATAEDIQSVTEKVVTLADGFELEADRISQVVGQMLSSGLVESADEGLDLLTVALQKVPAAVRGDILDAVDEYGPFFEGIGLSGEAAMTALVNASERGMYGIDKTGDAVKEFSIRATDMSTASVAAYEAAGLSAEDMAAKVLAGGDAAHQGFLQVVNGLLEIEDPVLQANSAIALFGTPLEDLGVNEIPQFLSGLAGVKGGLGEVAGAAQSMADTASGNVATSWEGIQRTFEATAITLGESFLPIATDVLGVIGDFAAWASENTELITVLGGIAAVLAGGILLVAAGMKVFAVAQAIQTAAQWASNAAWLASPITWIIIAIIAAIALLVAAGIWLYENWDEVTKWLGEAWENVAAWFQSVGDGIAAWWNDLWTGIAQWVVDTFGPMIQFVMERFEMFQLGLRIIGDAIAKWWNDLWSGIGSFFGTIWDGLQDIVRGAWNGIVGWIESGVNNAINLINGIIRGINNVGGAVGIHLNLIPNVNIPRLATGGITLGPQLAVVGDNRSGREAVLPLDDPRSAAMLRDAIGGGGGPLKIDPASIDQLARAVAGYVRLKGRDGGEAFA